MFTGVEQLSVVDEVVGEMDPVLVSGAVVALREDKWGPGLLQEDLIRL